MSFWQKIWQDTIGKVVVMLAGGFVLTACSALVAWPLGLFSSIVMADELAAAEKRVTDHVDASNGLLMSEMQAIALQGCRSMRISIGAAMRDLRTEIADMKARKLRDNPAGLWTRSDEEILIEWEKRYAEIAGDEAELKCE